MSLIQWGLVLNVPESGFLSLFLFLDDLACINTLKGLMLKFQYFGHLMWTADSLEKTDAGKGWRQKEKGATEEVMVGWHHWLSGHELGQILGYGRGREAWNATDHKVTKSRTGLGNLTTTTACIKLNIFFFNEIHFIISRFLFQSLSVKNIRLVFLWIWFNLIGHQFLVPFPLFTTLYLSHISPVLGQANIYGHKVCTALFEITITSVIVFL